MSGCSLRFNDDLGDKLCAMYPGVECVMNFSMARIKSVYSVTYRVVLLKTLLQKVIKKSKLPIHIK